MQITANQTIYVGGPLNTSASLLADGYYIGTVANYSIPNANKSKKALASLNTMMNYITIRIAYQLFQAKERYSEAFNALYNCLGPLLNGHTSLVALQVKGKEQRVLSSCGWDPENGLKAGLLQFFLGNEKVLVAASWRSDEEGLLKLPNLTFALHKVEQGICDEFVKLTSTLRGNTAATLIPYYAFKPQFNQTQKNITDSQNVVNKEVNAIMAKTSESKKTGYIANCSKAAHEVLAAFYNELHLPEQRDFWLDLQAEVVKSDNAQSHVFQECAFISDKTKNPLMIAKL
ncbi:hypothetical protein OGM23_03325 [Dickeya fangzhongdai]|uniref:hypothetical protein n=1 Tax=Dickeya fangzhongdai TaxID=1778540 RepID=UPI002B2F92B5|nr:hypothetical protein OGM23_03325 [Dickeya fangzhongdai]